MRKLILSSLISTVLVAPVVAAQGLGGGIGVGGQGGIGVSAPRVGTGVVSRVGRRADAQAGALVSRTRQADAAVDTGSRAAADASADAEAGDVVSDAPPADAGAAGQGRAVAGAAVSEAGDTGAAGRASGSANAAVGLDGHASDDGVAASADGQATAAAHSRAPAPSGEPAHRRPGNPEENATEGNREP